MSRSTAHSPRGRGSPGSTRHLTLRVARSCRPSTAGRILQRGNWRPRSQMIGAPVMGIGRRCSKRTGVDHENGRIANALSAITLIRPTRSNDLDVVFFGTPDTCCGQSGKGHRRDRHSAVSAAMTTPYNTPRADASDRCRSPSKLREPGERRSTFRAGHAPRPKIYISTSPGSPAHSGGTYERTSANKPHLCKESRHCPIHVVGPDDGSSRRAGPIRSLQPSSRTAPKTQHRLGLIGRSLRPAQGAPQTVHHASKTRSSFVTGHS